MKKLVISLKTSTEVLDDFARAFKGLQTRTLKGTHAEISFDNRKDFDRFVRHLGVLSQILTFKSRSVYELAKITGMDVSNLNKIILFFEEVGAVRIKKSKVAGRSMKTPRRGLRPDPIRPQSGVTPLLSKARQVSIPDSWRFFVSSCLRGRLCIQASQSRTAGTDPHAQKVRPLVHRQGKKTTNLFPHRALVFPLKSIERISI